MTVAELINQLDHYPAWMPVDVANSNDDTYDVIGVHLDPVDNRVELDIW